METRTLGCNVKLSYLYRKQDFLVESITYSIRLEKCGYPFHVGCIFSFKR